MNAGVVPDGVVRVKWIFTPVDITHQKPITIYPRVQNNVAVSPAPAGQGVLSRVVWYGATGRVIASYTAPRYASAPGVSPSVVRPLRRLPPLDRRSATPASAHCQGPHRRRERGLRPRPRKDPVRRGDPQRACLDRARHLRRLSGLVGAVPHPSGSQPSSFSRVSATCRAVPPLIGKITGGRGNTQAQIMLVPDGRTAIATTGTGASVRAHVADNVAYAASANGIRSLAMR